MAREHVPEHPSWDCLSCGKPWPCDPAREDLAAESVDVAGLAALMWRYFEDYALEVGAGPVAEAYERFLGWVRIEHPRDATSGTVL